MDQAECYKWQYQDLGEDTAYVQRRLGREDSKILYSQPECDTEHDQHQSDHDAGLP